MKFRGTPGRYLVVGHSNTTPDLVNRLGGDPGATIDEESEFDRLYVLVLHPDGSVVTVLLRYGDDLERSRTNLPGGTPNCRLNSRVKCAWSANPNRSATFKMSGSRASSAFLAASRRRRITN